MQFRYGIAILAVATVSLSAGVSSAQGVDDGGLFGFQPDVDYHPSRVLVGFTDEATDEMREQIRAIFGGETLRSYAPEMPNIELISTILPVDQTIWLVDGLPGVEYIEPDYVTHTTVIPNDQFFWGNQWGMHNFGQVVCGSTGIGDADLDAPEAWDIHTGDGNFAIGVADTGIQHSHPDLNDNIHPTLGWDYHNNDNNPEDDNGHGTHVSGTVGAEGNNGIGVTGMMWDCQIVPMKHLGSNGSGFVSNGAAAINYLVSNGVKVSNHSWGTYGFSNTLWNSVQNARNNGHLMVCAAGNAGVNTDSQPHYPSAFTQDNIISVAWMNNRDQRSGSSNYGPNSVDLGAPGECVASTYTNSNYVFLSGTSMASPHVAGVAGLVWSRNPGWSYQDVRQRILNTVRPVGSLNGITVTGGVVNAFAALDGTGGNPEDAPLNRVWVLIGNWLSGDYPEVQDSDDSYLTIESVQQGSAWKARTIIRGQSGPTTVSRLDIAIEGKTSRSTARIKVQLDNWDTGRWDTIGTTNLSNVDQVLSFDNIANPNAYVKDNNGNVRVRLTVTKSNNDFTLDLDEVKITVTP